MTKEINGNKVQRTIEGICAECHTHCTIYRTANKTYRDCKCSGQKFAVKKVISPEKGLKPKHHGELNKVDVPKSRLNQLRVEYEGDNVAQQQIDVYDGSTKYHDKLHKYKKAIKSDDAHQEGVLSKWFKKFYPDIT